MISILQEIIISKGLTRQDIKRIRDAKFIPEKLSHETLRTLAKDSNLNSDHRIQLTNKVPFSPAKDQSGTSVKSYRSTE